MRIGMGYDVHKLVEGRDCIIGGVKVPYEKGLLGHSDADVLIHAIMDALLGAAALGDIGKLFPDTDPNYKGANSLELLFQVGKLNIARALKIPVGRVSVKATTEEGLGFTGEGLGISAQAICLLTTVENYMYEEAPKSTGCGGCCGGCR